MEVKMINNSGNQLFKFQMDGTVKLDIYSKINMNIQPGEVKTIQTELYIEIPEGYKIQIELKNKLTCLYNVVILNSIESIDSDYKKEIKIILINHEEEVFKIIEGDVIVQLILSKVNIKKDILVCENCGGKNIQTLAWVDSNTNEYVGEELGDNWCEDCEEYVYLDTKEDYKLNNIKNE